MLFTSWFSRNQRSDQLGGIKFKDREQPNICVIPIYGVINLCTRITNEH